MADEIAPHLRPITFAANELALDLIYLLQSYANTDLESVVILLCVTDATMRPFMQGASPGEEALTAARPSNDIRGAISRRMIAEKTGISRESVRRKTQELADAGLVVIDSDDRVRAAQRLPDSDFQRVVENGHRAVMRYRRRLEDLGVPWDCIRG
jgi:biotin operon repressor